MLYGLAYAAACALLGLLARWERLSAADIELLALRHEARALRRAGRPGAWRPADRLVLAALSRCLPRRDWRLFPVHPATLRRWHRALLRPQRCAHGRRRGPGRPPLAADVRALIARLARENVGWGYRRIRGEPLTLGHDVAATAIRTTLRRRGIPPAPRRARLSWPVFLRAQAAGVLATAPVVAEAFRARVVGRRLAHGDAARRASSAGPAAACRRPPARARLGTPCPLRPLLLARPAPSRPGAALERGWVGSPPGGRSQPMHRRDRGVPGPSRRPRYPPPRAAPVRVWVRRRYASAEAARHLAA